jgi:hypothetical protein
VASGDATFEGQYTEGSASDSLGLISTLTITPTVRVRTPGDYSVSGELTDGSGNIITVAGARYPCRRDLAAVALTFNGSKIAASGKAGPFQLRHLTLTENRGNGPHGR